MDRALHLPTRTRMTLEEGARSPGAAGAEEGAAVLFDPTVGWWRLPSRPTGSGSIAPERVVGLTGPFAGPSGVGPSRAAIAWSSTTAGNDGRVEVLSPAAIGGVRMRTPARPVAGEAGALARTTRDGQQGALAAWVEDAGLDGFDIVATTGQGDRVPLASGPGDARLLDGDGRSLAWVEPDAVVVLDGTTSVRTRHPARTGFLHAPTVDDGVVCWEERPTIGPEAPPAGGRPDCPGDVDVRCSDGTVVGGPGDQLAPSRARGVLVFREGRSLRVLTTQASADGPR